MADDETKKQLLNKIKFGDTDRELINKIKKFMKNCKLKHLNK